MKAGDGEVAHVPLAPRDGPINEPFDLRGEFMRSYERWIMAKRAFEYDFKNSHLIAQAWEEYCGWRDMWRRS